MSDLIERLKHADDEEEIWLMRSALIAEIERLTAENSTLSDRAARYMLARDAAYDENAKLQAVVDAAKAVIPHAKGQVYDGVKVEFLEEAIAALETDDE